MSVTKGKSIGIVARLENSGEPVTANIHMVETTGHGTLTWADKTTGVVLVENEKVEVINDIVGQSQCVLSVPPDSVVGIYQMNDDEEPTGSNLVTVATKYGRTIDLNTQLATGLELLASYYKGGAVQNEMLGVSVGTARIVISADVALEKGLSQILEIEVVAKSTTGGSSGGSGDYNTYELSGPSTLSWGGPSWGGEQGGYYYPPGVINQNGGFNQTPNDGGIPFTSISLTRWTLLHKWMFGGTGNPNGEDVSPFITNMIMTASSGLCVRSGTFAAGSRMGIYAVGKPDGSGTTLTITADYEHGEHKGTVTKSVTLAL
jgi:hypothetical protein